MSKLPHIGANIFSVMSQMANQHNAINLAQGFPNFPIDPILKEITSKWVKEEIHQYLPMAGYPPLLDKIRTLTFASYERNLEASEDILITAGATQGIFSTIQALVRENDEVIILDPSYDCYETPIILSSAKPIRIKMNDDFTPNWSVISEAFSSKTKMIIINNPHNPSGRIWTTDDFDQLEKLLDLFPEVLVLSDEVYEYITFEKKHISVNHRPKLFEKSIVVSSFGKSFHITGWKIGYLIAAEHLMNEIKKVHQFLVFSVNSIAQFALNEYLDIVDVNKLGSFYQQKRDYFVALLQGSQFELLPCEGTYFQTARYDAISQENDIEFSKKLLIDHGVATIPLSPFFTNGTTFKCIRFCFAKDDTTLEKAASLLRKL